MLLPIPELENTFEKYKEWIRPLLSEEEYNNSLKKIDCFYNGVAKKLQKLLLYQKDVYSNTNWISSAWLNSYLDGRITPIIGTNFSANIKFDNEYIYNRTNEEIISNFIHSLGTVCQSYKVGTFGQVYDARKNEICLSQFEILRGSSRIPFQNRDIYNISNNNSNYITVFYKNNLFKIDILNLENEIINVKSSITNIINNTEYKEYSLSTICFADGDKAYELRRKYFDYNVFFNLLENSLFNISIFDEELDNSEEEFSFYMYLKGENTWIYKPLNFIYNLKYKMMYINCEHTYQDGGTILEIIKRTKENMGDIDTKCFNEVNDNGYIKIDEYFDDDYKKEADLIKQEYFNNINNFGFKNIFLEIDESYFKTNLKGLSKDAIMQFLLQYGQYKAFSSLRSIYEAVDMREYQYGRTECVRSISCESLDFIKSLENNDVDAYYKLKIAENEHKNRIKNCKIGEGVDRHLYGLYLMVNQLEENDRIEAHDFFNDISYKKISESFLSTTSLGYNDYMGYLLFTPVIAKGFGINYYNEPNGIRFVISYYKSEEEKANKFFEALKIGVEKIKNIKD